jgi:4-hydroxy-tetrahydrodipicolinate synthase
MSAYLAHCQWLLAHGCDGINVLGTTGEANSLAFQDRLALMETIETSGLLLSQLMVGTGACALADTVDLTRHAVQCGFAAQLILPPFYYKPVDADGLFAFFARLIDTVADDRLRVYLYNFPQLTGVPFPIPLIQRLFRAYPGVVVGLKDSSGDIDNAKAIVAACPGFAVFPSSEAVLLNGRDDGFAGCISATVNLTSAEASRVWHAPLAQDAEQWQTRIATIRQRISAFPLIPAIKFLLSSLHESAVWAMPLPPLTPLTFEQGEALGAQVGIDAEGATLR